MTWEQILGLSLALLLMLIGLLGCLLPGVPGTLMVLVAAIALRVILLSDGETVHNAFFDRNFEP